MILADLNTVILSYIHEILTLPMVLLIIFVIVVLLWHKEIGEFIKNLGEVKMGGVSLKSQQDQPPGKAGQLKDKETQDKVKQLRKRLKNKSTNTQNLKQEIEEQKKFIDYLLEKLETAEYGFLSYHLVPHTKEVLRRLDIHGPQQINDIRELPYISELPATETDAVVSVLVNYGLAEKEDNTVKITDKGRRFVSRMLS